MASHDVVSIARLVLVAVGGLALDLWAKERAFHELRQGGRIVIVPHLLEFQTMLNPGALFGIGGGQTTLFLVASLFALLLVVWMFSQSPARRWFLHIALGAILAGALGNMYDRITVRLAEHPYSAVRHERLVAIYMQRVGADERGTLLREYPAQLHDQSPPRVETEPIQEVGFVRDFIKIPTRWFGHSEIWPWVFNVADTLLVGGVIVLTLAFWTDRGAPREGAPDASAATAQSTTRPGSPA